MHFFRHKLLTLTVFFAIIITESKKKTETETVYRRIREDQTTPAVSRKRNTFCNPSGISDCHFHRITPDGSAFAARILQQIQPLRRDAEYQIF